jgi:hypothetical protein
MSSRGLIKKLILTLISGSVLFAAEIKTLRYGGFSFEKVLVLPGSTEELYDAATGDISGWWDHSFSENPKKFYIEPKPGGGFYEIYNDEGDGVLHGTVIIADRGRLLRVDGPLGLSGMAIKMVFTYEFNSVGEDSTEMKLLVKAAGEIGEGLGETVEKVWDHFLFDKFKPYVENKMYLNKR